MSPIKEVWSGLLWDGRQVLSTDTYIQDLDPEAPPIGPQLANAWRCTPTKCLGIFRVKGCRCREVFGQQPIEDS